ncbi:hypothetical protein [Spiroplasma endosymbiont of Apeira syringaria]|uniref:hypothetical protein n=1 Tax=Spiroplasma endosymbiont of Apeira syringaria TaxID=3066307 RepID=UPI0030D38554
MKLNEFNNAFQTEQQCLAYIANLKENKCIRCFNFNLNTSDLKRAFLPLCTILILSHKCWEKPIYGLLPTFLNQT